MTELCTIASHFGESSEATQSVSFESKTFSCPQGRGVEGGWHIPMVTW